MLTTLLLILGLVLLIVGAEALVRGASGLARSLGISPLVVGLTVVAFGTSAPELAVCIRSALQGQPDLLLGNVVGSNIANILLILGLGAALSPMAVKPRLVRRDVPVMIGVSLLLLLVAWSGRISRWEGLLLVLGLVAYNILQVRQGSGPGGEEHDPETPSLLEDRFPKARLWALRLTQIVGGLILLVLGSHWLVNGAVQIARYLGATELIIGLTIIAVGTSLPEIATTILAARRGEGGIAIGNAVGSNIFNVLSVLGVSSLLSPAGIPVPATALAFDIPIMLAAALACWPIFFTGRSISRWEGFGFLGFYAAYTAFLFLSSTQNGALRVFTWAMLGFVVPITAITLVGQVWREVKRRRGQRARLASPSSFRS